LEFSCANRKLLVVVDELITDWNLNLSDSPYLFLVASNQKSAADCPEL